MISFLKHSNWIAIKILVLITLIVPLSFISYEILILGKDSVVFMEGYPPAVSILVIIYYCLLLVAGILWLLKQFKSLYELKNEKTKNEILYLQNQVNPHFFFNMLNNLYGVLDKDVKQAKTLVLKLSELMRYSIYESEKEKVTISMEIAYLKDFIDLHKMRYRKNIAIHFEIDIEAPNILVKPLLLIILVENAFKHGVEKLRDEAYVNIYLKVKNNILKFEVINNFDPAEMPKNNGIGLKNLQRRLLLAYPQKYTFHCKENVGIYTSTLELHL